MHLDAVSRVSLAFSMLPNAIIDLSVDNFKNHDQKTTLKTKQEGIFTTLFFNQIQEQMWLKVYVN